MNNRYSLRNRDEQRQEAEQIIFRSNKGELERSSREASDQNGGNSPTTSKYSKVFRCSFVRGTEDTISLEAMEAEKA